MNVCEVVWHVTEDDSKQRNHMRLVTLLAVSCISIMGCFAQQKCYYDTVAAVSGVGLPGATLVMTSGQILRMGNETQRGYHWVPGDKVSICHRHNDVANRDEWYIASVPGAITTVPQHHW